MTSYIFPPEKVRRSGNVKNPPEHSLCPEILQVLTVTGTGDDNGTRLESDMNAPLYGVLSVLDFQEHYGKLWRGREGMAVWRAQN